MALQRNNAVRLSGDQQRGRVIPGKVINVVYFRQRYWPRQSTGKQYARLETLFYLSEHRPPERAPAQSIECKPVGVDVRTGFEVIDGAAQVLRPGNNPVTLRAG